MRRSGGIWAIAALTLAVKRVELCFVALLIGLKNLGIRRVGSLQRLGDIADIELGIDDRLPGMRVSFRAEPVRGDAIGCGHHGRLAAGRLQPAAAASLRDRTR